MDKVYIPDYLFWRESPSDKLMEEVKNVIQEIEKYIGDIRKRIYESANPFTDAMNLHKELLKHVKRLSKDRGRAFLEGPPWKNTLHPSGCEAWVNSQCNQKRKDAAKAYCENLRYISHDEFVEQLITLYKTLPTANTYYIIGDNNSSEYIFLLLSIIDPSILERVLYISLPDNDDWSEYGYSNLFWLQLLRIIKVTPPDEPIHIISLDDMSYAAGQILVIQTEFFEKLKSIVHKACPEDITLPRISTNFKAFSKEYAHVIQKGLNIEFHMAFTYITEKAHAILQGDIIYEPFEPGKTIPLWGDYRLHTPNIIPSLRKQVGDDMFRAIGAYFGYPSHYSEEQVAPDSIVYFDHKVADDVSTIGLPLLTGQIAPGGKNAKKERGKKKPDVEHWVLNYLSNNTGSCDRSEPIIPACRRVGGPKGSFPYSYPEDHCPMPWYKRIRERGKIDYKKGYRNLYPELKKEGGRRKTRRSQLQKRRSMRKPRH
jgi:hypothetical protein